MIIDKLNKNVFYNFVSEKLGIDVINYEYDMHMQRNENSIQLKLYLGGEMEDERDFLFKDSRCIFRSLNLHLNSQDLSYDWVNFLVANADELTEEEKQIIVNKYNRYIEKDIANYANQKRQLLIQNENLSI